MSMTEYARLAGRLMAPETPRHEWPGLFRDVGRALQETMTAPNDPSIFEGIKILGGTLLVATQKAAGPIYRGREVVARPWDNYLQIGIFPGVAIDVNDPTLCGALADTAVYIRQHGLEASHPHIIGYTHRPHAEAAARAGFSGSPVRPGTLGALAVAIEREYASFTPEGQAGVPMGPVYISEQPTAEFVARNLRPAA